MEQLIIRIGNKAPEEVQWAILTEKNEVEISCGSLADVAALSGQRRLTVLVPGQDVLLTRVDLPGRSKVVQQAIPFALEEQLAADPDALHFAHCRRRDGVGVDVAVVARSRMDYWCSLLDEAGLEVESMIPEQLALPMPFVEKALSVLADDVILVRREAAQGFAVDKENFEFLIISDDELKDLPLHLYQCPVENIQKKSLRAQVVDLHDEYDSVMAVLAAGLASDSRTGLNLLQGEYGRHAQWGEVWKNWRFPLVCLLVTAILYGALVAQEFWQLRAQSRELGQRIEDVLLTTFPETKRIVNARSQMSKKSRNCAGARPAMNFFSCLNVQGLRWY